MTLSSLLGVLVVLAGCGDEIIEVERPVFDPPPDATFGFLGYFTKDDGSSITTCGNCHVGKNTGWTTTGHAGAWDGLQESGHAQALCEGCHTVNENGNALTEAAGYNLVQDERYHDVQCESCHGPGLEHVQNPDASQPLASIAVGVGLGNGCGDCHTGAHHPFVDQWAESKHGSGDAMDYAGARDGCNACHEGRVALEEKFGEYDDYVEKDGVELQRISCAVCHDPHGSPNENNLRAPIDVATTDHLCVTCHSRRGTPWSSHGPHSPQGLLVLGTNVGWIPPGFDYDTLSIISTHGSTANPKLCATCHVNIFEVTDAETGDFLFASKGHSFEAIPCVDVDGLPVSGHNCGLSERTYAACSAAGCHGSPDAARSALTVVGVRLNGLLDDLWDDTDGNHHIDATDGGLLPQVVALDDTTQLDPSSSTVTVAKGALWNAMLAHGPDRPEFADGEVFGIHFSAHRGSGRGAHNPFLLEALLIASIDAVQAAYGLAPPPGFDRVLQTTPPPGLQLR